MIKYCIIKHVLDFNNAKVTGNILYSFGINFETGEVTCQREARISDLQDLQVLLQIAIFLLVSYSTLPKPPIYIYIKRNPQIHKTYSLRLNFNQFHHSKK